jgi:GAF domain-containing protein
MKTTPTPSSEAGRLEALRAYHILDTAPEHAYDDVTQIAAFICGAPIALMTCVDTNRLWFKSRVGLDVPEIPREQAFCAYTILNAEPMEVEDTTKDARFATNPTVTNAPNIRFYAGAPLVTPDGHAVGSLCVLDQHPRRLNREQRLSLEKLARIIVTHMEFRRVSRELAAAAASIKTLSGIVPICASCKQVRNDKGYWQQVEAYLATHTEAKFSHSYCPTCVKIYLPETETGTSP